MKGPNLEKINYYKNIINVPLIASGGVASLKDISKLAKHQGWRSYSRKSYI